MSLPLTVEQEDWLRKQNGGVSPFVHEYEPDYDKKRGKHYTRTAGYADKPGTGPEGETCGSCEHAVANRMANTYWKCDLCQRSHGGSRRTDILLSAPACKSWERKTA